MRGAVGTQPRGGRVSAGEIALKGQILPPAAARPLAPPAPRTPRHPLAPRTPDPTRGSPALSLCPRPQTPC